MCSFGIPTCTAKELALSLVNRRASVAPRVRAGANRDGIGLRSIRTLPSRENDRIMNMKKHRGQFVGPGLAALLALSAGEAKAEVMTLSVIYGGHTYSSPAEATP